MYLLITLMTLGVVGLIAIGIYLELNPGRSRLTPRWYKPTLFGNLLLFVLAQAGLMFLGVDQAMANIPPSEAASEISLGMGLAIIGVGIPTALSTIAAGIAVGTIGAASLAVLAEKPDIFGRTLIYLGLAEGIAIYGLVMSILLLNKL